ncbi:MAG TPA: hypothetical protein VFE53_06450 [Mucilaginibacter sp.]|jgi:hypothetical protein|nr:hypothetical protein [Mucilaginibacter sp.]
MITKILKFLVKKKSKTIYEITENYSKSVIELNRKIEEYRKLALSQDGRIRILEEQQQIQHNFLVEINKYLVKICDERKK